MVTTLARILRRSGRGLLALPLLATMLAAAAPPTPASAPVPYLVKDINSGSAGSYCRGWYRSAHPTEMDGWLYFTADDGVHGCELWKSDGTASGTALVKDIKPGPQGSDISGFTEMNGALYFGATDGVHGTELWKTDGTASGTVLVKDINDGGADSYARGRVAVVNGMLYFGADDGTHGRELWKSGGTAASTSLVRDILPGKESSSPMRLTEFEGELFFAADATEQYDFVDHHLWKSNGTETGTVLVGDSTGHSLDGVADLVEAGGTLFVWVDAALLQDGECDGRLWKTDGTDAGTVELKGHLGCAWEKVEVGGKLFFTNNYDYDVCVEETLWRSDGTKEGTFSLRDFSCRCECGALWNLGEMDGLLYFSAEPRDLWKSDGTLAGTTLIKPSVFSCPCGADDYAAKAANGTLYVVGYDEAHGDELWKSDGTSAGTARVSDINPGAGSGIESIWFATAGGKLFFPADNGSQGVELWALNLGDCSVLAQPLLLSPTNYATTCDATPELSWKPVSGAFQYQIRIADADTSEVVIQTGTQDNFFQHAAPLAPGTYTWRVRAFNDCGWSAWSEKWRFTVLPPPAVPVLSSPVDGSSTYEPQPIFAWSATAGANQYQLQVDDEASFATPVVDRTRSSTSYQPPDPLPPGTYHWRVRAVYDCGNSAWTAAYRVTILPAGLEYGAYLPLVVRRAP